ncbi:DUF1904 family protein [Paenibacillus rhizovicinus]|uniref:DUF1904 family protein n=1 Tax=Paenibacillus rhizovicinus TaxID=2704463 RepID=A0A6C0P833_9BACL|nr:DUF1904 family protein [Paenibacillus rhizovicinus]QHW34714.1 DUF1904 family protein [Paenibacillus rhizovicinus]
MPFLRFKGFTASFLKQFTPSLVEEFSNLVKIPQEIVKVELLDIQIITNTPRSLEILMFQRAQELHDAIASKLHRMLVEFGYENVHIFFVILSPALYYKEGQPLLHVQSQSQPV